MDHVLVSNFIVSHLSFGSQHKYVEKMNIPELLKQYEALYNQYVYNQQNCS